jgi:serine/threonine protein kinase
MPKYRKRKETGNTSEYESDGDTIYRRKKILGRGCNDEVWQFLSSDRKQIAITQPITKATINAHEIIAKFNFLSVMHPGLVRFILLEDGTYVLRTPEASGEMYEKIGADVFTPIQKIELFLSAVQALSVAHEKGYVVLDLKEDNIFYDTITGGTTLVDGGMSAQMGRIANEGLNCKSEQDARIQRESYDYIAPEFWATSLVIARASMDVYALGSMMKRILGETVCPLDQIIEDCLNETPRARPTLSALNDELTGFLELLGDPVVQDFAYEKKPRKRADNLRFHAQSAEASCPEDDIAQCVMS